MAHDGTLFIYGALSLEPTPFPTLVALIKSLTMRGYVMMEMASDPLRLADAQTFITRGLEDGALRPIIAETFDLDHVVDAHRYMESNQQFGKLVVTTR